jgi:hydrogenase maturation protease
MAQRTLVAGAGNIFFGDDGFGVAVARRLAELELPEWVTVADYGISGMHLAYDLASGFESAILIDAVPRGGTPGTVYVIEPEPAAATDRSSSGGALFDAHGMRPDLVLGVLEMLGAKAGRMLVVGCEPSDAGPGMGLSAPVAAAVDNAVRVVLRLVDDMGNDISDGG